MLAAYEVRPTPEVGSIVSPGVIPGEQVNAQQREEEATIWHEP
jgi:hypothetical protein